MAYYRSPESRSRKTAKFREAWKAIRGGAGFIYAAEIIGTDLVKIGFSVNPEKRTRSLSAEVGRARLVATIPATIEEERALHSTLSEFSVRGELYRRSILSHSDLPAGLRAPLSIPMWSA